MSDQDFWNLPPADRLAQLQADRASHEIALEELAPFIERATERLAACQADYDLAAEARGSNQLARAGVSHAANETWHPDQAESRRAAAESEAGDIGGAYELARARLEAAMATANELARRRGVHRGQIRQADTMIASTQIEVDRERSATEHQAATLARIRDRLPLQAR